MNNESNTYEIDDVNAVKNTQDSLNLLKIQNKKLHSSYINLSRTKREASHWTELLYDNGTIFNGNCQY